MINKMILIIILPNEKSRKTKKIKGKGIKVINFNQSL